MIIHNIKKEINIILIAIAIGALLSSLYAIKVYSKETVEDLSDKIVRFRVLANSNSEVDQNLKLIVKESVISHFEKEIRNFETREDALETFDSLLEEIQEYAKQVISDNGYNYDVNVKIDLSYFPTRTYGNVSLPNGEYTTLIIEIGSAQGENWWCVMFPPLCFVDETMEYIPSDIDEQLQYTLDEDEYALITNNGAKNNFEYDIKFKLIEFFN